MNSGKRYCENCIQCQADCLFPADLPEEARGKLTEKVTQRRLPKGSVLFQEGDTVDAIYILRSGRVKLTRWNAEGHEQIVGFFSAPEAIWEGMLLEGSTFPYSAQCLEATTVCCLHGQDFAEVLKEPAVALHMMTMLSQKLHDANERNLVLSTKNPKSRVAAFLLYRETRDRAEILDLKLDDIAASLNLRPETVSRKLGELQDEGIIQRIGKSGIQIIDMEALDAFRT